MMYNKPESVDQKQLHRCLRLLGTDEFAPLIQRLHESLSDHYKALKLANDATLIYRTQGRILAIEDLLDAVAEATKRS